MWYQAHLPPQHSNASSNGDHRLDIDALLVAQAKQSTRMKGVFASLENVVETRFKPDAHKAESLSSHSTKVTMKTNGSLNSNGHSLGQPHKPLLSKPYVPGNFQQTNHTPPALTRETHDSRDPQPSNHRRSSSSTAVKAALNPPQVQQVPARCQATNAKKGMPCQYKANSLYEYLVCGNHKRQYQFFKKLVAERSSPTVTPPLSSTLRCVSPERSSVNTKTPLDCNESKRQDSSGSTYRTANQRPQLASNARCTETYDGRYQTRSGRSYRISSTGIAQPQDRFTAKDTFQALCKKYVPNHLTPETQRAICRNLLHPLAASDGDGYIYCFEDPNLSNNTSMCLKVGRSIHAPQRLKEWARKRCGPDKITVKFQKPIHHHMRVEHLVHLHLIDLSRNAQHLELSFAGDWVTGSSVVRPRVPISLENPFKHGGTYCFTCDCMHKELFLLERFDLTNDESCDEDEGEDEDEGLAKREHRVVEVVERVLEYWTNIAQRIWPLPSNGHV